jgi:CDP-glucose 4,6-dehydratase
MAEARALFGDIYRGRRVLVTGHTGFKGSWLALWLTRLGARVVGYSLPAPTQPDHWGLLGLDIPSVTGDVRDGARLREVIAEYRPEVVFHLAAQPLVRRSYRDPVDTFATNILGTLQLYEACRQAPDLRAVVTVTSDKVYENHRWAWGYRETDALGGYDPYSCSKACTELVTACYRNSFWNPSAYGSAHHVLVASVRAGNVIGGGDWAEDRLVPDVIRAAVRGEVVTLRSPRAVRPWQHVLEPLSGYLLVGQRLFEGRTEFAGAWNFGPGEDGVMNVEALVRQLALSWPKIAYQALPVAPGLHEAELLMLDSAQARLKLGWRPVWGWARGVEMTVTWYRDYYEGGRVTTEDCLRTYIDDARCHHLPWSDCHEAHPAAADGGLPHRTDADHRRAGAVQPPVLCPDLRGVRSV